MIKVLNLYCGIGGNRTHWTNCQVTAVEHNQTIASFYRTRFSGDTVVVGDAHEYLKDNYRRFDFIWSSVPCQSHSRARFWSSRNSDKVKPVFPDMKLYQEILLLQHYFDGDWIVENVVPYYDPLIEPTKKIGRHLFWSNRKLSGSFAGVDLDIKDGTRAEYESALGIELGDHKFNQRTDQILRNCVHPEVGRQVFDFIRGIASQPSQPSLFDMVSGKVVNSSS